MANLSEDIQCAGSDTRPPMLDRTDFASWQQRIRLYFRGKENRVNILKSIDEGPFQMGTFRETLAEGNEGALHLGPERPRVYSDLSPEDKERYNADIRATNILLQELPKDIYSLINHYTNAKDIWDNLKMLLEGLELTKEDRESQLYDDFEHFCQHKGETIRLLKRSPGFSNSSDMRNIKMTMSRMQLNSKFVNNMLPEWGRFVTAVKLNRGLRDSNYDQLYAYLKQHEAHANENKMLLDRFTQHTVDPLALISNVAPQQYNSQSSTNPSSTYVPPHFADNSQLDSGLSPTDNLIENLTNTLALLTQSYKTYLPQTNNQLRTSSNPRNQATVQDGRVVVQNVQDNVVDEDVDEQPVQDLALNVDNVFQSDDCDAFDYDVDEAPTTQTMFMDNLSSADPVYDEAEHEMHDDVQPNYVVDSHADYTSDSNIIPYDQYVKDNAVLVVQSNVSSIPNDAYMMIYNDMYEPHAKSVSKTTRNTLVDNSLTAELATYKEQVELYERRARFELTEIEQKIDEQLRIVITDCNIKEENLKKELHSVKLQLASTLTKQVKALTKEIKEIKYIFEELEAEVNQNGVDRKHDEIERKNLLIANDILIADCLSKEVFYVAMNSELNVSSFTEMHDAHTCLKARCLELKVELSNLRDKIEKDNHTDLVKRFSNLEAIALLTDSIKITRAKHLEQAIALLTENESLKVQIQNKLSCVNKDHVKPKVLAPGKYGIDVEHIPPRNRNNREVHLVYLKHLKESVETLREIVEEAKVERPLDSSLASALRVNSCTDASKSQPRSNTKKNKILPAKSANMKKVEEHHRTIKSSLKTTNRVDSSISSKYTVIQIVLWYLDSGCSKHMTGDRSRLRNFVKKFIGTVRFGNDHFGAIMGYGDYVIGESVISRVYYMEGLGHNLFSIR
ncbi:hypothetical protein Tco_0598542 [Tanacetum coccineum]